jgi:hypothetical protein
MKDGDAQLLQGCKKDCGRKLVKLSRKHYGIARLVLNGYCIFHDLSMAQGVVH